MFQAVFPDLVSLQAFVYCLFKIPYTINCKTA
jgi:hypothetical protein